MPTEDISRELERRALAQWQKHSRGECGGLLKCIYCALDERLAPSTAALSSQQSEGTGKDG